MKKVTNLLKLYKIVYDKNGLPWIYSVKSKRILEGSLSYRGYRLVTIIDPTVDRGKTMTYARALMMIKNPIADCKNLQVDHINRNKRDDRFENLRWVTRKENMANSEKSFKRKTYIYLKNMIVYIYDHNNDEIIKWSQADSSKYIWPEKVIKVLAVGKGCSKISPHYSAKYNISCFIETKEDKMNNYVLCGGLF